MRIVHLAPRLPASTATFPGEIQVWAEAQAQLEGTQVELAAVAGATRLSHRSALTLRTYRGRWPAWLDHCTALRQHLHHHTADILHAHNPGQRALHYANRAAQHHGAPLVISPGGHFGYNPDTAPQLRLALEGLFLHPQALEHASGWHATSAEEAAAIRACGFRQPICIAPTGVVPTPPAALAQARAWWLRHFPIRADRPVAVCTAPFAPESRLAELLELWQQAVCGDWLLLLAGTAGRLAPARLQARASLLGLAGSVLIAPGEPVDPLPLGHLYLAPSRLPAHAAPVANALALGLPALVAAEAPWSRLEPAQAGWCVPWAAYGPALRHALALPATALAEHRQHALALAQAELDWSHNAATLLAFYRNLRC